MRRRSSPSTTCIFSITRKARSGRGAPRLPGAGRASTPAGADARRRRSRSTRRDLVVDRLGVPADRVTVCYPGAPAWRVREEPPVPGPILHIGTIEPRKNAGALVAAYLALAARDPEHTPAAGLCRTGRDAGDEPIADDQQGRLFSESREVSRLRQRRGTAAAVPRSLDAGHPLVRRRVRDPGARGDDDRAAGRRRGTRLAAGSPRGRRAPGGCRTTRAALAAAMAPAPRRCGCAARARCERGVARARQFDWDASAGPSARGLSRRERAAGQRGDDRCASASTRANCSARTTGVGRYLGELLSRWTIAAGCGHARVPPLQPGAAGRRAGQGHEPCRSSAAAAAPGGSRRRCSAAVSARPARRLLRAGLHGAARRCGAAGGRDSRRLVQPASRVVPLARRHAATLAHASCGAARRRHPHRVGVLAREIHELYGVPASRIEVVPNGVPARRPDASPASREPLVLYSRLDLQSPPAPRPDRRVRRDAARRCPMRTAGDRRRQPHLAAAGPAADCRHARRVGERVASARLRAATKNSASLYAPRVGVRVPVGIRRVRADAARGARGRRADRRARHAGRARGLWRRRRARAARRYRRDRRRR